MFARFCLVLSFLIWVSNISAQIIYATSGVINADLLAIDVGNGCATTVIGPLQTATGTPVAALDIAVCPDGNMYITNAFNLYSVDPATAQVTIIGPHGGTILLNALACSPANVLYGADINLYEVNTGNGNVTNLGALPFPSAGDLVFQNGVLHYSTITGIYEVDIANPPASPLIYPTPIGFWGLTTINQDCSTIISGASTGDLVTIDLTTQTETPLCNIPSSVITGLTSFEEFAPLPPDCNLAELDLDDNNSSGAPNADYNAASINCATTSVNIADFDASINASQNIGSMTITLASGVQDGPAEFLTLLFANNIIVNGSGTGTITLTNAGGATTADYLVALNTIVYENLAMPPTPGFREVEVFFELNNGVQSNVATAFIQVEPVNDVMVDLGPDTGLCAGESITLDAGNPGASYNWSTGAMSQTIDVSAPGLYSVTVTDSDGCQGEDQVFISINPPLTANLIGGPFVCEGESTFIQIILSGIVSVDIVIENTTTGEILEFFGISTGFTFPVSPTMNSVYEVTSIIESSGLFCPVVGGTHEVEVFLDVMDSQTLEICEGESVVLEGAPQTTPGIYTDTYVSSNGCDSIVETTLIVLLLDTTLISSNTCIPGMEGTIETVFMDENGCDSTVIETISYVGSDPDTLFAATCDPAAVGLVTDTFLNAFACDSLVTTITTLLQSDTTEIVATTCDPNLADTTVVILTNSLGCDSVVITGTLLVPSDSIFVILTTCDPDIAGLTIDTFSNQFGCDSLIFTETLLLPSDTTLLSQTTCDPGQAGIDEEILTNIFGCDSLIITETLFIEADTTSINLGSCDPADVGVDEVLLMNAAGCDSLIITTTVLLDSDTTELFGTSCDPNAVGVFETLLMNAEGCDSLIIETITFSLTDTTLINSGSCDPVDVGVFETLLVNSFGCDSLVIETVSLFPTDTTAIFSASCDPQDVGVFENLLMNGFGCDSLVIETVSLLPSDTTAIFSESCDPLDVGVFETLLMNGFGCDSLVIETVSLLPSDTTAIFSESCDPLDVGVFETLLVNDSGCDSLIIETVSLLPSDTTALFSASCDPQDTGVFETLLMNSFGCDSLVVVTISLLPTDTTEIFSGSCDPQDAGVFETLLMNGFGCDSLIVETVSLLPSDTIEVFSASCDPLDIGVFESLLMNSSGCDSLVIETVSLLPSDTTEVFSASCNPLDVGVFETLMMNSSGCDSLVIETVSLLPSDTTELFSASCDPLDVGVFETLLTNTFGCDSLVVETVSLLPSDVEFEFFTTCDPGEIGLDTLSFTNSAGCDSLIIQETTLAMGDTCAVDVELVIDPIPCFGDTWSIIVEMIQGIGPGELIIEDLDLGTQISQPIDLNTPVTLGLLNAGNFIISVTTFTGIIWTETIQVLAPDPLSVDIDLQTSYGNFAVPCSGSEIGAVLVEAMGGTLPYSYSWSTGDIGTTVSGLGAGSVSVTVTDGAGCTASNTLVLAEPDPLEIEWFAQMPLCFGEPSGLIELLDVNGGIEPYLYFLDGVAVDVLDFPITDLYAGNYTIEVQDAIGCSELISIFINDPLPLSVNLGPDQTVVEGTEVILDYELDITEDLIQSLLWTGLPCLDCEIQQFIATNTSWYSLEVTSLEGCTGIDSVLNRGNTTRFSLFHP